MSTELEEVGRWLIQVLYDNYNNGKSVSASGLADVLELDELIILDSLRHLIEAELVYQQVSAYRLSEKGYTVAYQRASSYCPHL